MLNRVLNKVWPIAPFFTSVAETLKENHAAFDFDFTGERPLYLGDDKILLRAIAGLAGAFQLTLYVEQGGKVVVSSVFYPDGYELNWRERALLRNAVLDWVDQETQNMINDGFEPSTNSFHNEG